MTSQVFYRKWRPQTLGDVVGQEQVTQTLLNALRTDHVSHAYLFCGPRGTGKTSTGRILAKAVNCLTDGKGEPCNKCAMCQAITEGRALDVVEVDAASNRGIDEIRDLREKVNYAPNQARRKVYIIDEVHMLTKEASNALLKTLEEPPAHVIFVLATTEVHKVLPTILSRCQRFDFRRIAQNDVAAKLGQIAASESIKVDPVALRLVARAAGGSLRDAENLLQQLTTYYGAEVGLRQAQETLGVTGDARVKELLRHIVNNEIPAGVSTINNVNRDGLDLQQFNRELVEYLRGLLLVKTACADAVDLPAEDIVELKELATRASLPQILKAIKLFGQLGPGLDSHSTLPLELALIDCSLPTSNADLPTKAELSEKKTEYEYPVKPVPHIPTPTPVTLKAKSTPEATPVAAKPTAQTENSPQPAPPKAKSIPVAEPVAAATPAAQPETQPIPLSELEQLKAKWRQFLKEAPAGIGRTPAAALLRSAKLKIIQDNTVVLAFKFPSHKENMEKPENRQTAEKIISSLLGRPCRLSCIHEPADNHLVQEALKMGAQYIDPEGK